MKAIKFSFIVLIVLTMVIFSCKTKEDPIPPDPDPVNISIMDLSVAEGNTYSTAQITLQLDAAAEQQITANISTSDGTAEANKDFIPISNQAVVFAPGETSKTYEITIAGDMIFEEDEYFEVTITSVTGPATIDDGTARVDLTNEDEMGAQEVNVDLTVDWTTLLNLAPGSEVPYEIMNFGQPSNVPNAEFTSVAALGDTISWNPQFSPNGDTILYYEITFDSGIDPEDYFDGDDNWTDSVGVEAKIWVINDDVNDLEFKYDLHFYIGKVSGERIGPFVIDPKLRIPN